jgi:KaiC/GvpD/RAD55 family RecA-like ATPase
MAQRRGSASSLRPAWYHVVGLAGVGKTLFCALQAKQYETVIWINAEGEESPQQVFAGVGSIPVEVLSLEKVTDAFDVAREVQDVADLVVIDSLTALRPAHPAATQVYHDLRRAWFRAPMCPMLVVSQWRYPHPSPFMSSMADVELRLVNMRRLPALYTLCRPWSEWLVWWAEKGPELVPSLSEADYDWVPQRMRKGGDFRESSL